MSEKFRSTVATLERYSYVSTVVVLAVNTVRL